MNPFQYFNLRHVFTRFLFLPRSLIRASPRLTTTFLFSCSNWEITGAGDFRRVAWIFGCTRRGVTDESVAARKEELASLGFRPGNLILRGGGDGWDPVRMTSWVAWMVAFGFVTRVALLGAWAGKW